MAYERTIMDILDCDEATAEQVEDWMRSEHSTLDGLRAPAFRRAAEQAYRDLLAAGPLYPPRGKGDGDGPQETR